MRTVRGAVAGSVATLAALLSHLLGGGTVPAWYGIVVPWALSLLVCAVLAGRHLSPWRLAVSVALGQALFHALFAAGAPATSGRYDGGHGADGVRHAHGEPSADLTMWLWHLVAAAVTVVALYRGERLLLRLRELAGEAVSWVRRRLGVVAAVLLPAPVVAVTMPVRADRRRHHDPHLSVRRRRGPPASPCA